MAELSASPVLSKLDFSAEKASWPKASSASIWPTRRSAPHFEQLLVQLRLRDVAVVVLVQDEGAQARAKMQSGQLRRAVRRQHPPVRGRPALEQKTRVVRPDTQVLYQEWAVTQETLTGRHAHGRQRAFFMNIEADGLRRAARIRAAGDDSSRRAVCACPSSGPSGSASLPADPSGP